MNVSIIANLLKTYKISHTDNVYTPKQLIAPLKMPQCQQREKHSLTFARRNQNTMEYSRVFNFGNVFVLYLYTKLVHWREILLVDVWKKIWIFGCHWCEAACNEETLPCFVSDFLSFKLQDKIQIGCDML